MRLAWIAFIVIASTVHGFTIDEFELQSASTKCVQSYPVCQKSCFAHPEMHLCGAVFGMSTRNELMTSTLEYPYLPSYAQVDWDDALYVRLEASAIWGIPLEVDTVTVCNSATALSYLTLLSIADSNDAAPFQACDGDGALAFAFSQYTQACTNLTCVLKIPTATIPRGFNLFRFTYLNAITNSSKVVSMVVSAGRLDAISTCRLALSGKYRCESTCYTLEGQYQCEDAHVTVPSNDYTASQQTLIVSLTAIASIALLWFLCWLGYSKCSGNKRKSSTRAAKLPDDE